MKTLATIAVSALIVASFGTAAFAEGNDQFAMVDGNKDNQVSWTEAVAVYPQLTQAQFDKLDTNKDAQLSEAEFGSITGLFPSTNGGNTDTTSNASSAAM
jgi:hypothetical protein